ncbi:MAG TPA: FHA domain-containing protein [Thermoanaerobaculia bacterium]|nr:FHA domain-containing protein [Thermoanaerobaculia bacterium]
MSSKRPQLAREIILAIGDNMREGLEPLLTRVLAPSLYQVYLHPDDFDRLGVIFREIEAEAKAFLDRELQALDRQARPAHARLRERLPQRVRSMAPTGGDGAVMQHVPAGGQWHIRFQEDPNDQLATGEVEVVSELAVGDEAGYGSGRKTQRIAVSTTRKLQQSTSKRSIEELEELEEAAAPGRDAAAATGSPAGQSQAWLEYDDEAGSQRFALTKDEVVVGRGAVDVWVDLRLEALPDVSRRHLKIRREPQAGSYWLEDLSQFGTSVDGRPVGRSGAVELRDGSRIGLADVMSMVFRRAS